MIGGVQVKLSSDSNTVGSMGVVQYSTAAAGVTEISEDHGWGFFPVSQR